MKRIESIKVTAAALSVVVALTACATKGSEDNGTAEGTQAVATRETDIIVDVAQTTDTDTQRAIFHRNLQELEINDELSGLNVSEISKT